MATYMLTGVDTEKWRRFKVICDLQGITIKESFIHHINYTIVQGISQIIKPETDPNKPKQGGKRQ